MAVTVRSNPNNGISVTQGSGAAGSITVNKSTGGKLQSLSDVVVTGLQDGYTIVYDVTTNKWVAQSIEVATANIAAIDGGVY